MMSQGFKSRFEQMQEGKPTNQEPVSNETGGNENSYAEAGHVRNVCFIWPDGKMKFLNYAYLVSGEYLPDEGTICLIFTSETVIIKGSDLDFLFKQLLDHIPKYILSINSRYKQLEDGNFQITEIIILKSI